MATTRRKFLKAIPAAAGWSYLRPGSVLLDVAQAATTFPSTQPPRTLFPTPADGATVGINPPGFAWWRAPGAAAYRIRITQPNGRVAHVAEGMVDPVHLPAGTLPPGEYRWEVEALDAQGQVLALRGAQRFIIPGDVPQLAWESPKAILAQVAGSHPRFVFLKDDLPRIRQSLATTRRRAWEPVKRLAEQSLATKLPEPPRYHTFEGQARQRMGYTVYFRDFRGSVDRAMGTLALAHLLTGDERYGLAAKRILLEVVGWGVDGPMSVLSPFGDEPGLSMARHGHRAYDWLYDLFDEKERAAVRDACVARARQVLQRLRKADYLANPAESHNGRMIAYLSEYAIVLKDDAPDAAEWLDYSLRALTTFYPHWGAPDGGWAEGVSYAIGYNSISVTTLEVLRAAAGVDLWKRPFFRNVRRFFLYCAAPNGEIKPFGDGAERGGVAGAASLMRHYGRRLQDPSALWWAGQVGQGAESAADPLLSLTTEDALEPAPPRQLPTAAAFPGIGWAALHSALDDPERDTFFLLKSSPFGSVSHSHADQNSFAILKGGRALAIPSGHYGPSYGMPHHAEWTRQTKANNCVLVNGEGQVVRDPTAAGRIVDFQHRRALSYVCGDAAAAYGGKLTRFLRHVLFVRPGLVVVLDDLAAPEPATFQWLLHTLEKIEVDPSQQRVIARRGPASLTVRLHAGQELEFSQTDQFDPPYNAGNPPEYHQQMPNHWHFTAATRQKVREGRIAAIMLVEGPGETLPAKWQAHPGWVGVTVETPDGVAEAWAQTASGARGPREWPELANGACALAGRWRPKSGTPETFLLGKGISVAHLRDGAYKQFHNPRTG